MKYLVRDCDPNTGEPDDDGYDDEYVVSLPISVLYLHLKHLCASCPIPSLSVALSVRGSGSDGSRPHPESPEAEFRSSVGGGRSRLREGRDVRSGFSQDSGR